jgi:hypothetical protein
MQASCPACEASPSHVPVLLTSLLVLVTACSQHTAISQWILMLIKLLVRHWLLGAAAALCCALTQLIGAALM